MEVWQAKQIRILKNVQIQDVALCRKIKSWKTTLAQLLLMKLEFGYNINFKKINKTNTAATYTTNQSKSLGRASHIPGSSAKSGKLSIDPGMAFVDMQANTILTKFVNNTNK